MWLHLQTITRVACGHNHTIAVDDAGSCYTWGSGNYGRLGHRVQRDEMAPKKVRNHRAVDWMQGALSSSPGA
jgi:alpha-tubulin suppressor-like RCC1 family protein